jgi:predicted MPP superfamily phosphohydrolase
MLFVLVFSAVIAWVARQMLRDWHPRWWAMTWIRRLAGGIALTPPVAMLVRTLTNGHLVPALDHRGVHRVAGFVAASSLVLLVGAFFALPLAALVRASGRRALKLEADGLPADGLPADEGSVATDGPSTEAHPSAVTGPVNESTTVAPSAAPTGQPVVAAARVSRRVVLEAAAASVPIGALGAGVAGIAGGLEATRIVERPMRFAALPEPLRGLRILQLTDLHIGAYLDPRAIEELVERAHAARPDLVVLTGDICDHEPWLERSLRAVERLDPRLGAFAVFGNHEYFGDARAARRSYDRSRVRLINDRHARLDVGGAELTLVGVDDPRGHGGDPEHYARHADRALASASSEGFRLGLCHRPNGFAALADRGVDLTLSGHTHGGQLGRVVASAPVAVAGDAPPLDDDRSLFESAFPRAHLWGRYERNGRQLYTSSGGGHWFAFRLACPSEAALITLEQA